MKPRLLFTKISEKVRNRLKKRKTKKSGSETKLKGSR